VRIKAVATLFQFGSQLEVVVNLSVENDSAVAIFREDGLVAVIQVDDFEARGTQREKAGLKDALLIGAAMNERCGGLADTFRGRAPVLT